MIQSIRYESPATGEWKKTVVVIVGAVAFFPTNDGFGGFDFEASKMLGTVKPAPEVADAIKSAVETDRRVEKVVPGDTAPAPVPGGWSGFGAALNLIRPKKPNVEPERVEVANDLGEGLDVEEATETPDRAEVVGRVRNVRPK